MSGRKQDYNSPLSEGFPARLVDARHRAQITQRALGLAVGYSSPSAKQAVDGLEKGRTVPSLRVVEELAQALGVDPRWLAFGDLLGE